MLEKQKILQILKPSSQRALVGIITEKLFAVTVGVQDDYVKIVAYFYAEVNNEDAETINVVGSEVAADLPENFKVDDFSLSMIEHEPQCLDFWAFKRAI